MPTIEEENLTWFEDDDMVTVELQLPPNTSSKSIEFVAQNDRLKVSLAKGPLLLSGQLFGFVTDASTWTKSGDVLEISLAKSQAQKWGHLWKREARLAAAKAQQDEIEPTSYYWLLLLFLRLTLLVAPSYLHPDEFFQGPEPLAARLWPLNASLTWEFTAEQPVRSAFSVLGTSLPFMPASLLVDRRPYLLLLLPRLWMCLLSFGVDWALARLCYFLSLKPWPARLTLASAWPLLIATRPLTNGLELLFFALALLFTAELRTRPSHLYCFLSANSLLPLWWPALQFFFEVTSFPSTNQLDRTAVQLGAVLACGLWSRFTFLLFYAPVAWLLLAEFKRLPVILLSFLGTAGALVCLDFAFYGKWLVTPLNLLLYNLDPANLAIHGTHPRWLHLLNLVVLFGPALLICLYRLPRLTRRFNSISQIFQGSLAVGSVLSVALLSVAPHQEARFLLPLLLPVSLLAAPYLFGSRASNWLFYSHLIFNATLLMFYGFTHQAAVLPSLYTAKPGHHYFHNAYMLPAHLTPAEVTTSEIVSLQNFTADLPTASQSGHSLYLHTTVPARQLRLLGLDLAAISTYTPNFCGEDTQSFSYYTYLLP